MRKKRPPRSKAKSEYSPQTFVLTYKFPPHYSQIIHTFSKSHAKTTFIKNLRKIVPNARFFDVLCHRSNPKSKNQWSHTLPPNTVSL